MTIILWYHVRGQGIIPGLISGNRASLGADLLVRFNGWDRFNDAKTFLTDVLLIDMRNSDFFSVHINIVVLDGI